MSFRNRYRSAIQAIEKVLSPGAASLPPLGPILAQPIRESFLVYAKQATNSGWEQTLNFLKLSIRERTVKVTMRGLKYVPGQGVYEWYFEPEQTQMRLVQIPPGIPKGPSGLRGLRNGYFGFNARPFRNGKLITSGLLSTTAQVWGRKRNLSRELIVFPFLIAMDRLTESGEASPVVAIAAPGNMLRIWNALIEADIVAASDPPEE